MRWTQDGCGEEEDGPSYECVYTELETELSFLPVLLYFKSSWSFKPRQCEEYSTFSGSGGPGFGSPMRVFSLDKFTG